MVITVFKYKQQGNKISKIEINKTVKVKLKSSKSGVKGRFIELYF